MTNPLEVTVKSITTENVQKLYLSDEESKKDSGKRVLIVDDVISTGESLNALMQLVEKGGRQYCRNGRRAGGGRRPGA